MTEHAAEPISIATEAALEVLDSATLLMVNMAAVTRLPEAGKALQALIGCRLVELLEIYIRRVLELIFTHDQAAWSGRTKAKISVADVLRIPRDELLQRAREEDAVQLAGKFEDTQKLLTAYLKTPPFTPEQLQLFLHLKDVRNLLVHNNGLVDRAFADKYPDVQVGERLDDPSKVLLSAFAMLDSVKRIDALVVTRYPDLAVPALEISRLIEQRMAQSQQLMKPTQQELQMVLNEQLQLLEVNPQFASLIPSDMAHGFGALWNVMPVPDQQIYALRSFDGRAVWPFSDEVAARAWLEEGKLDWQDCEVSEQDEAWTVGQLANGFYLRWPTFAWAATTEEFRVLD